MIGEVVLFRIHDDPIIDRPLLVVSARDGLVSGELFLDWEQDRCALWVQKNSFYLPHRDMRAIPVEGVLAGAAMGQWHRRPEL